MRSLVVAAVVLLLEAGFLLGVAVLPEPAPGGAAALAARPAVGQASLASAGR